MIRFSVLRKLTIPAVLLLCAINAEAGAMRAYVGTYTSGESQGIYRLDFDSETGAVQVAGLAAAVENPSFLAIHPRLPMLYAACRAESGDAIVAFEMVTGSGDLKRVDAEPAGGQGPCHVAVSPDGALVALANYGDGTVSIFPLDENGRLGAAVAFFQHEGSGPNAQRQQGPHAHSVNFDATGAYLVVADLGIDKLMIYRCENGAVRPHAPAFGAAPPGGGPRHFAFHPAKAYAYGVNEMGNSVTAYRWDASAGTLDAIASVPTLPADFNGENTTAHIEVHPSGRFVYASNRGHDSIAAFTVNPATGGLTPLGQTKTGGQRPRNFTQDPAGAFLLAANQDTNDIFVFRIDPNAGTLTPTGFRAEVPSPVCLVFAR